MGTILDIREVRPAHFPGFGRQLMLRLLSRRRVIVLGLGLVACATVGWVALLCVKSAIVNVALKNLRVEDEQAQDQAARTLARVGTDAAIRGLLEATRTVGRIRLCAFDGLAALDEQGFHRMLSFLDAEAAELRAAVAAALLELVEVIDARGARLGAHVDVIRRRLTDSETQVRLDLIHCLRRESVLRQEVIGSLIAQLATGDGGARASAAELLGTLRARGEGEKALLQLLSDASEEVRRAASEALAEIRDLDGVEERSAGH